MKFQIVVLMNNNLTNLHNLPPSQLCIHSYNQGLLSTWHFEGTMQLSEGKV